MQNRDSTLSLKVKGLGARLGALQAPTSPPAPAKVLPWELTYVQYPVPRPVPPPALQLLMLCVLQPPVMKHHPENALEGRNSQCLELPQETWQSSSCKALPSHRGA